MLELKESDFIGKGCHKLTYFHPNDKSKCVKVIYNKDGWTDINRELSYRAYRKKKNLPSTILPQYYGEVETDKGRGFVFEYICDYDGKPSITLETYAENLELFARDYDIILSLMKNLITHIYQDRIISMAITSENIIFQQISPDEKRAILITDLGFAEHIPFVLYSDYLAYKKIKRKTTLMLEHHLPFHDSPIMRRLLNELKGWMLTNF